MNIAYQLRIGRRIISTNDEAMYAGKEVDVTEDRKVIAI